MSKRKKPNPQKQKPELIDLGRRICKLREEFNLTQGELGEKCGVSQRTIGKYELGWHEPTYEMIKRLAAALKTTAQYLLDGQATIYTFPKKANTLEARYLPILSATEYKNWRYSEMEKYVSDPSRKQLVIFNADGKRLCAMPVEDDSMFYRENDDSFSIKEVVVFDVDRNPEPGDFVVVDVPTAPKVIIRQYLSVDGGIHLRPINQNYPTVLFNPDLKILGVVCKKVRDY